MLLLYPVREFTKRVGDDLPFYYWTANERYREWDIKKEGKEKNTASETEKDRNILKKVPILVPV